MPELQTRNPNAETRKKPEIQMPKPAQRRPQFGLRASDFLRISRFGFRISLFIRVHPWLRIFRPDEPSAPFFQKGILRGGPLRLYRPGSPSLPHRFLSQAQ